MSTLFTRLNQLGAIGLLSTGLMLVTSLAHADEHAHKPREKISAPTLKQGERWATDATLRRNMDNIRLVFITNQDGILKERLKTQDYQHLAQLIDKSMADIVKNCKLTQVADEAFHVVVIADLVENATLMRTASNIQTQRVGALGALQTLGNYGKYFQHPRWNLTAR